MVKPPPASSYQQVLCTSSALAPEKCRETQSILGGPSPDIVVYLTCSPEVQLKRIKARGRSFESGYTLEYLQSITDRLSEYVESLAGNKTTKLYTSSLRRRHEKCTQTRSSLRYLTFDSEKFDLTKPAGQKSLLTLLSPLLK
ncbi:MAG: deoxynucleoside kinase [bacterium]